MARLRPSHGTAVLCVAHRSVSLDDTHVKRAKHAELQGSHLWGSHHTKEVALSD